DLDGDGVKELAVLVDNKKMEFYKIKDEVKLIGDYDLSQLDTYTGAFGNLYSHGKYVYTTIKDSKVFFELTSDMSGNIEIRIVNYPIVNLGDFNSYYKVDDVNSIISSSDYNLAVLDSSYRMPEMHRTSTPTDFVYANENEIYVTGDKTVFIYDITNEPNKDDSQKSFGYFGYQPMDILSFDNNFYSINLGIDFNFDGKIDETVGDQKPSINKFDLDNSNYIFANNQKQMDIDFPINFPLNTNISSDGDIILPSGNMAYYYNVNDNKVYDSLDAEMYVSCAFRVLDYLVLGERDMATNKSYVRIKKGDFIDVNKEVGTNVTDLIVYQNASGFGVVSLSEGNFGQADSKINILKLSIMGFGDSKEIVVGTGGSNIVTNADQTKAAIVMNGSHEIHILDLLTDEIIKTFSTGTTGYGGPRDAKFLGDMLYVTTYSNQVLVFNSITGEKVSSILVDGLTEGLALTDKYLLAANIDYSNYKPSNRIFAYNLDKISDVKVTTPPQQVIRVYPNPVVNDFHLVSDDLAGKNDIAIINSAGKIVATHSGSSNGAIALNADALGLTAGNYTAVINGTRAVRFVVIK
ncbi:T9SS type A sorting domain-containing protein, partial [bacterium]